MLGTIEVVIAYSGYHIISTYPNNFKIMFLHQAEVDL